MDLALDHRRHEAIMELLDAMVEQGDRPDTAGNVIVCHRHGARKPTETDYLEGSIQGEGSVHSFRR